ncbi:MAG TPA: hypothetical protein VKV17_22380 [Bryobacteraceae bacterium]|nr:hypothetical protein [Bryobacteraceae bacterium]
MRLPGSFFTAFALSTAAAWCAEMPYFSVLSQEQGSWPAILSSIGFEAKPPGMAHIFVARGGAAASSEWQTRVENGAVLILEGESSLAELFGFRRSKDNARVGSLTDVHNPKLPIVWEKALELPVFEIPAEARVFAHDRWSSAPLIAGYRRGAGAVLWVAVPPGERGYERFPYLLAALCDLGVEPPFRTTGVWAFFDSGYRSRVDLDYFAQRWHKAGISALQVAAWHFYDPTEEGDGYLRKLIEACHRAGILVYAWFELPHVSDKFWNDHPEWREKTGVLQDAQLDWRKLMNLTNRDCFRAVSEGVRNLLGRFDWDGANLAELYFESLEGAGNPSRFTPMNDDVRKLFEKEKGFDPVEIFRSRKDAASQRAFLDFRSELAGRIEEEWLGVLESVRASKPDLDLVLTHVDDRFDKNMRDAIGADATQVLPLLDKHSFTFLIEDPATIWNQGPQRYRAIAEAYQPLTTHREKLAIDLNIVDRYQNVYPTKQQTGTELFELVHQAALNFRRTALYVENSLLAPDLGLLPAAAAAVTRIEAIGPTTVVESANGVGLRWKGGALVDGHPWPAMDGDVVWLPAGKHTVAPAVGRLGPQLLFLNAELRTARVSDSGSIEFSYISVSRAIAILDRIPGKIEIDGSPQQPAAEGAALLLPRGQHLVAIRSE